MKRIPEEIDPMSPGKFVRCDDLMANLYETVDAHGDKQVAVLLQRKFTANNGREGTQELKCDLDRLEAVVRHGEELKSSLERGLGRSMKAIDPTAPESVIHLGSWTARYYEKPDADGKERLVVHIEQSLEGPGGKKSHQSFGCDLGELAKVAEHGLEYESERGHEPRWNAVVRVAGLDDKDGFVRVQVMKWEKDLDAAQMFADKNRNHGYGLFSVAFRRPIGGTKFSFTAEEETVPTLANEIRFLKAERDRTGPNLLLGIWYQQGSHPREGTPVSYDIGQDPTSREPTSYRVVPRGVERPQGMNEEPLHVIVEVDTKNHPPTHRIKAAFKDGGEAEERFKEMKAKALDFQRESQAHERKSKGEPTRIDLSQDRLPDGRSELDLNQERMPGGFRR